MISKAGRSTNSVPYGGWEETELVKDGKDVLSYPAYCKRKIARKLITDYKDPLENRKKVKRGFLLFVLHTYLRKFTWTAVDWQSLIFFVRVEDAG